MTVAKEPTAEAQRRTEQVALAAFVSYSLLAGGNAVCIRFSNRELAPLWGAGLRFALAAALLLLVMAVLRLPIPRGRALAGAVLYGVFTFTVPSHSPTTRWFGCTQGSARSSSLSSLSPP